MVENYFKQKREIPLFKVYMSPSASDRVSEVLKSGFIGEGPQVKEFEKELQQFFGVRGSNIITVNSATSGEHLLYHYFKKDRVLTGTPFEGIGQTTEKWDKLEKDDEVLSTPLTCTATNWPIINEGLNLRWVDVDPLLLTMDLDKLEEEINEKTRIITVVHWGGNPIDLDKLSRIVSQAEKKYGRKILVFEDCAHAFGSVYKNKPVGFTGNFSTFSLQAIKHITSVDGGLVISPYHSSSSDFRLLRWYGIDRNGPRGDFRCEADVLEAGFKYHMNDVSAAVGRANLEQAHNILSINKSNGAYYNQALRDVKGITTIPQVEGADSAYWLYTFHAERRDELMKYLDTKGIKSSRVHERNDRHTCTIPYRKDLPGVDKAVSTMLSIPVGYWVSPDDRDYIVECIKDFYAV
jgi:dTDP-4-amino-4,6-dideoxygalactose transaminase